MSIFKQVNRLMIVGLILYAAGLVVLSENKNFEVGGALIVLASFGFIFPALAWLATIRAVPLSVCVRASVGEMLVLATCVVALSIYLIGGPQWIDNQLPQTWMNSLQIKFLLTLAKKLIVFVVIPYAIFRFLFGYQVRDFGIQIEGLRALGRSHLPVVLLVGGALILFNIS
jgi:hypothetical protein